MPRLPIACRSVLAHPGVLVAAAVLGLVTTILIAVLAAALDFRHDLRGRFAPGRTLVRERSPAAGEGAGWFQVSVASRFGATKWSVTAWGADRAPGPRTVNATRDGALPRWSISYLAPYLRDAAQWPATDALRRVWAAGWPTRCLFQYQPVTSGGQWKPFVGAFSRRLPFGLTPADAAVTPIPTLPIWGGLAFNTVFFGAGWLLLFLGVSQVRRQFRVRRNSCPNCTYNLSGAPLGSPCPECGHRSPCTS
jgi:hypothetical protein